MSAKHTPGPWRTQKHDSLKGVFHIDSGPIGYERETVAIVNARKQSEANARLIAAAPDLLEALENLYSRASSQLDRSATHDGIENCKALADARAAIARATGS